MDISHLGFPFTDEQLRYFHFLTITKSPTVNIHVQVLFGPMILMLLHIYLRVDMLGHKVILCLKFLIMYQVFFHTGFIIFIIPLTIYEVSRFFTFL